MFICWHCFREKNTDGPCPFCNWEQRCIEEKYPLALRPGSILNGHWIIGHVIGQGGYGITYIAQDYHTKERVAIKEYLPAEMAGRSQDGISVQPYTGNQVAYFAYGKEQFLNEAKTLAAFNGDEHIVRVYSFFEENNTAYFVMEYVDGMPLNRFVERLGGTLTPAEANRLFLPLMRSLETVHAQGIVHRDIAPDNIIVSENWNAKLIDFGAARYSTGEKSKSLDVILKHGFAPKEQYTRRGRQGPWTDVYALAATYYYSLTGKIPPDAIDRIDLDELIIPSALGVKIDSETEKALLRALELNAADRWQSMAEFASALSTPNHWTDKRETGQTIEQKISNNRLFEKDSGIDGSTSKNKDTASSNEKSLFPKRAFIFVFSIGLAVLILIVLFSLSRDKGMLFQPASISETETNLPSSDDIQGSAVHVESPAQIADRRKLLAAIIAGGSNHVLCVREDGSVAATGSNSSGQCSKVNAWENIVSVAAGNSHSVGLHNNGSVVAVGLNSNGECDVDDWKDIVAVAAGSCHSIGLRSDGTVVACGNNDVWQCAVDDWDNIISIAAGSFLSIGLKADGTVIATGWNNSGQCKVSDWNDIVSIAVGYNHTIGVKANGSVLAVGSNAYGQRDVDSWTEIIAVAAGKFHTVGLHADGTVVATGDNSEHQCEISNWSDIIAVAAGDYYTIGLKSDASVVVAGNISDTGFDIHALSTKPLAQQKAYEKRLSLSKPLAAGAFHSVGLCADGSVVAIGHNDLNECNVSSWKDIVSVSAGDFSVGLKSDGTVVATSNSLAGSFGLEKWKDIIAIDVGNYHTVGLKQDGRVVAVGNDDYCQCDVEDWSDIINISAGSFHTVGLKNDGTAIAVGLNDDGQCNVAEWYDLVAVAAGYNHTLGLRSDGTVLSTGDNSERECNVDAWTDIVAIDAGDFYSLGLTSNGFVYACGRNDSRQCSIAGSSNVVAFAAGKLHTVWLRSDGTVLATGYNNYGQCNVSNWTAISLRNDNQ